MKRIFLFVLIALVACSIFAESFDERLQRFADDSIDDAKAYVKPLATSFGSNLNTGLYNTAEVLKPSLLRPIRFGFNFNTMMALVPDSEKSFTTEAGLNPGEKSATVYGDKGGPDTGYPGGLDLTLVPLIVPQVRFGIPWGNELMIRYMPPVELSGDLGKLDFWGVGLKHSIDQYIPLFPVHLAVQGAYQSFSVGDLVEITSIAANAHVSKKVLMLTLYGGVGWEDTTLDAKYTYVEEVEEATDLEKEIEFDIKGDNNFRMTAGFRWALLPFIHLNADYSISTYQVVNLGLGVQF